LEGRVVGSDHTRRQAQRFEERDHQQGVEVV
jgi:hypothetical protein